MEKKIMLLTYLTLASIVLGCVIMPLLFLQCAVDAVRAYLTQEWGSLAFNVALGALCVWIIWWRVGTFHTAWQAVESAKAAKAAPPTLNQG